MDQGEINTTGKFAAILSATEIGVGSMLHAWRLPFSGHFLSLNQGFILGRSVRNLEISKASTPFKISIIAASLKSLSPAGKRLTPMLAISIQGLLYTAGLSLFGRNYFGRLLAMILLSLWAFLQPLLLYLLVFGRGIVDVGQYFLDSIQGVLPITWDHLLYAIAALVILKMLLAITVNHLASKASDDEVETYFSKLSQNLKSRPTAPSRPMRFSEKLKIVSQDLLQPWFLVSMGLVLAFVFVTEPNLVNTVWYILRPLALGFMIFYALRFLPLQNWLKRYVFIRNAELSQALEKTLVYLRLQDTHERLK